MTKIYFGKNYFLEIFFSWQNLFYWNFFLSWKLFFGCTFFFQQFYFQWYFFVGKYFWFEHFLLAKFCLGKISFCTKSIFVEKILWNLFLKKNVGIFFCQFFLLNFNGNFCLDEHFFQQNFVVVKFLWQLEYVQDGPRNLPLKFGQNQVSDSWNVPDMDKCCKDKCCLNRCYFDKFWR